ncbi:MAG: PKD domain-containing protein [Solirubrobacterales bacterium]
MPRRPSLFLILALALLGCACVASQAGAARFYTPDYGSKTPGEIGGFDLGSNGSLTPIPGSPFAAEEPGLGGLWGLAFSPDGTRAMTGFFFTGGVQAFTVPPSGIFQLAGPAIPTASATSVAISPDGRFAFASTREFMSVPAEGIRRFAFNPDGSLAPLSPAAGSGEYADVALSPDGRFLFASTGSAIDRFALGADGSLTPLGSTPLPGAFLLVTAGDSNRLFVLVGGSSTGVASFAIGADGSLSQQGSTADLGTTSTKVFAASPDGRHVFVPDYNKDLIRTVSIAVDGAPTAVPGGMSVMDPEAVGVSPDSRQLVFYRAGGSENALGSAMINADGTLIKSPFETKWSTGEPEPIVFQPHPAPVARFSAQAGAPGQALRFDAAASERAARFDWNFGDGTTLADGGPSPKHTYAKAGDYTVTLTVTDSSGCSARSLYSGHSTICPGGSTPIATGKVDTLPVLGKPKAVPKKFRAKPKGKAKGKFGTSFRYAVNETATVRFKIERKKVGRLVGGKCKPLTKKNAGRKKCPIFKRVGSRSQQAKAGANRLKWNGKLKGKPLPPGSYRATVVATDRVGGRSAPQTVGFRILPPPKQP